MNYAQWHNEQIKKISETMDFTPKTITIFKPPCLGPSEAPRNPWHDIEQMFIEANQKIDRVIEAHYIWGMLKIKGHAYHREAGRVYHLVGKKLISIPASEIWDMKGMRGVPIINSFPKIDPVKVDHPSMASFARNVGFSAKDIINPDYVFVNPRLNDHPGCTFIDDIDDGPESDFSRLKQSITEWGKMIIKPAEWLFNLIFKKKG